MSKKKKALDLSPKALAREQRAREAQLKKAWPKIERAFRKMGRESGNEIAELAQKLHPTALVVVLYRSAFVLLPQTKQERGHHLRAIIYHDPAWMGEERTLRSLVRYKHELLVIGQRSGPDFYLDNEEMWTALTAERMRHHKDRAITDFAYQKDGIYLKPRKHTVATFARELSWGALEAPARKRSRRSPR